MITLSHEAGPGGQVAPCWRYSDDVTCPVARVPGSASGAGVILLRTRRTVLAALRSPLIRDLATVSTGYALAGVSHEHPDGLLRGCPAGIRRALGPLFSVTAIDSWRPRIAASAALRARTLPDSGSSPVCLAAAYAEPLAADVTCLAAGLQPDEWEQLTALSARANALILAPADHDRVSAARRELYDFCRPLAARAARGDDGPALLAQAARAMRRAGYPPGRAAYALATILGGFPSLVPVLTVVLFETLARPELLARLAGQPGLVRMAVHEHLRRNAHFTFALPGVATADASLGPLTIPAGAAVLPVIRAAQHDPARVTGADPAGFDLRRPRTALLAFGAGPHVCLGRAFALAVLEEGLRALADLPRQPRLAEAPAAITWQSGLMPVPAAVPVLISP